MLLTLATLRQGNWGIFLRRNDLGSELPEAYQETITMVADFADPILTGAVTSGRWEPSQRMWLP